MFKIQPIDMIAAPNSWAVLDSNVWNIIDPNPVTLWFQLAIVDSLGTRPYAVATGATLSVVFRRADLIEQDSTRKLARTSQNLTKTATFNTQNRALGSIVLAAADVSKINSGAGFFTLVESATTTQWVQDWLVSKKLTSAGF